MGLTLNTSNGQITLSSSTAGNYEVTRTVTNTPGNLSTSATDIVTINPADSAAFSYSGSPYDIASASNPTPTVTGLPGGTFSSTRDFFNFFDAPDSYTINTSSGSGTVNAISFWFKPQTEVNNGNSNRGVIIDLNSNFGAIFIGSYAGSFNNEVLGIVQGSPNKYSAYTSTTAAITVDWHHVAITWNTSTTQYDIWLDNVMVTNASNTTAQMTHGNINIRGTSLNYSPDIQISNFINFTTPINSSQVNFLYNGGFPTSSVVGLPVDIWYKMSSDSTFSSGTWTIPNAVNPGTKDASSTTLPSTALNSLDINSTTGLISLSTSSVGTFPVTYDTTGATGSLCPATSTQSVQLVNTNFNFPTNVCNATGSPDIAPTNFISGQGGSFSMTPSSGLAINNNSSSANFGTISPTGSTAGTYAITYTIGSNSTTKNVTSGAVLNPSTTTNTSTLSFNGTSSYINTNFNPSNSFTNGDSITISMWVKSGKGSFPTGLTLGGNDGSDIIYFQPYGNFGNFYFSLPQYNAYINWGSLSWNTWHHVIVVYDHNSASLKAYKNGVESTANFTKYSGSASLGSIDLSSVNTNLYIGADSNNGTAGTFFQGEIDEVAIWNTAITSCDAAGIYQASSNGITADLLTVYPSNLKYYNRMGD